MFAEDIVEEVYAVIQETFEDHPDLPAALEFLETILGAGELLARREYRAQLGLWIRRVRDHEDAPLAAAALVAKADGLVTGDRDLLVLEQVETIPILRTKQLLDLLDRQPQA